MGGEARGRQALRAAVRERAERQVDVVKIMVSGGFITAGTDTMACQFSLDELRVVVEEAHHRSLAVTTAHAHGLPAVHLALAAGVDGIEHCTCLTERGIDLSDGLVAQLAGAGVVVCPTLGRAGVAPPPAAVAFLEARRAMVGRMHHGGVVIVSGSDAGILEVKPPWRPRPGSRGARRCRRIAAEATATATSVAAQSAGLGSSTGRLEVGFDADLLVVDGDLSLDIEALDRVQGVYIAGRRSAPM